MDKRIVSWGEVEDYIYQLEKINEQEHWSGVYGVPRGGIVLAVMISHRLDIPFLGAPCKNCLIVDDIADTGRSLCHYTENETQHNKYFLSTMFLHEQSIVKPNYSYLEKNNLWIVFPWENIWGI